MSPAARPGSPSSTTASGLEVPGWPGHQAGQHLDVRLTAEDGYTAERSYSCGATGPVAETVVYLRGPGTVVRCRTCSGVLMVISKIRGVNCVDVRGLSRLAGTRPAERNV